MATNIGTSSATLNGKVDINIQNKPEGYVMFFYGDKNEGYTGVSEIVSINPKPKIGFWDERLAR
ncbi:MAG: hypothetical protein OZ917_12550 [Candidatus Brocadiaceae bacterium]|nr:hypothetical protein [Candidatus Brocadiaceae bacterium]